MSKNFINTFLENFPISLEEKEWIMGLISDDGIPEELEDEFEEFLNNSREKADENDPDAFKLFVLYAPWYKKMNGFTSYTAIDILTRFKNCFNTAKFSRERIKKLQGLFTQKKGGQPVALKPYAIHLLPYIYAAKENDNASFEAYQKILLNARKASPATERVIWYLKPILKDLPNRTYEPYERPLALNEIILSFRKSENYPYRFIAEMEGISEETVNYSALPFLVYGEEGFKYVSNVLFLLCFPKPSDRTSFDELIAKVDLSQWSTKNHLHEFSLLLATAHESMAILDRVFEGISADNILHAFLGYIENQPFSIYKPLLKDGYFEDMEPIRKKLEYLDWAWSSYLSKSYNVSTDDKCRLFLNYMEHLSQSGSENKRALSNELSQLWQKNNCHHIKDTTQALSCNEEIVFPAKIEEFICSKKILDRFSADAKLIIFNTFTILCKSNIEDQDSSSLYRHTLERVDQGLHFPLYLVHYLHTHAEFNSHEFFIFLLNLKKPSSFNRDDASYSLELVEEACRKGVLTKEAILEELPDFVDKHPELLEHNKIEKSLSYFAKSNGDEILKCQTAFFLHFYEQIVQESEDTFAKLHIFLKLWHHYSKEADSIFENHPERLDEILSRCRKALNNVKHVEQEHCGCIWLASLFIYEKTTIIWKALKSLLIAFRNSKEKIVTDALTEHPSTWEPYHSITTFFQIADEENLKNLRYDMAHYFTEMLKPTKKTRQAEYYTQVEQNEQGFDLSYAEPSPIWRHAYVRALSDLGVKNKNKLCVRDSLMKVLKNDPSDAVKNEAKETVEKLDRIRKGLKGSDHKKSLFEAFWWLRRAHLLSLGIKPDSKKAHETRITEWL